MNGPRENTQPDPVDSLISAIRVITARPDSFAPNPPTRASFFPLAFTGVCTQEMCDISSGMNAYSDLNAEIIAVSVDSPFAQEAWAQKENIQITLASDLNKKTAETYGVLLPDLLGLGSTAARAAFVIDKQGVIHYSEQTPSPKELPNFHAIKEILAKLK
jgi:glutaredoxin-dependent peroxiredoxin